jgi:glutathione S-transferase
MPAYTGGELDGPAYSRMSCFHLVPVIDDDGFVVAESAAVLLYLAEKARKLIPADFEGRTRVVQWCFAALTTVERPLMEIQLIDKFVGGEGENDLATISEPLRDALLAYSDLEANSAPRVVIAQRLLGPAGARVLLPQLDEIARNVRPRAAARETHPGR